MGVAAQSYTFNNFAKVVGRLGLLGSELLWMFLFSFSGIVVLLLSGHTEVFDSWSGRPP